MLNEQQSTDPNLAAIAGNSPPIELPSRPRKRKDIGPSDTPSQGVEGSPSKSSSFRPLAKRPTLIRQSNSSYPGGKPSDRKTTGSTGLPLVACPWRSHLERITSLAVEIMQISRIVKSTLIQQLYNVDVEPLLQQSQNLQLSYLELQECLQQSTSTLMTCPWRSHLDRINSLAVAVSQISQEFNSATIQLFLEVDVEALRKKSDYLQQSYFKLQECVQSSVPSSGGAQFLG